MLSCIIKSNYYSSVYRRVATNSIGNTQCAFQLKSTVSRLKSTLSVAIVGRPNVGKSTLFNRLTNTNMAIVSDIPGTTRDRREGKGYLSGINLVVIDTGGLDEVGTVSLSIQNQVESALRNSDVILFLIDAKMGITPLDQHFSKWLRKKIGMLSNINKSSQNSLANPINSNKIDIYLLANKTEGSCLSEKILDTFTDCLQLGYGQPIPISASHGEGISDLALALLKSAEERGIPIDTSKQSSVSNNSDMSTPIKLEDKVIQLAIMGRPNVGKSSILNAILGDERVIVGPAAGLTRDAVHVEWSFFGRYIRLVDTAGLTHLTPDRRLLCGDKKKVQYLETIGPGRPPLPGVKDMDVTVDPSQFSYKISEQSLVSALNALRFAQVVLLVVEGGQGTFSKVDLQLARRCLQEGRAVVIAANKCDLLPRGLTRTEYEKGVKKHCEEMLPDFGDITVVSCTANKSEGMNRLLHTVIEVHDAWSKRVDTWVLNSWLNDLMVTTPAARSGSKAIKIKYITQIKARPPTFALFSNIKELPGFFERFLRSRLQRDFKLQGVPIRFMIRRSEGKAVDKTLLSHGRHTRRGVGRGSDKGVGPKNRDPSRIREMRRKLDTRRRKDSRQHRIRNA